MIKNSEFFLNNLKNIVFLGSLVIDDKFLEINKKYSLNTEIITSPDQKNNNQKKNVKVFEKLDKSFEKYISKKFNVKETLFISIASRWIISKKQLENFFRGNLINSHPTRLPIDAGSGGFSWQIMRGDRICNQLFHLVDENLDTGPIIFNRKSIFPNNCKIPKDYYEHHFSEIIKFYEDFIKKMTNGKKFKMMKQSEYLATYNPRLSTNLHGWIDWNYNSINLTRFIAAFDDPYSGASTYLNKRRVRLKKAHLHGGEIPSHPFASGIILRNDKDWIVISTKDENHKILVEEVLDEKGNNLIKELKVGDRFFTPYDKLENAKNLRVKFGPKGLKVRK